MSKKVGWAAVMTAILAGTSLIAYAQNGPGPAGNNTGTSPSRVAPGTARDTLATGMTPGKSSAQDFADGPSADGSGIDCPPPLAPPYNSQPVKPPRLPPCR